MSAKKEKEYFSHDYNSRNDPLMVSLFQKYKLAGIGAYWCIVEMLYESNGYIMRTQCDRIAFELRVKKEFIESMISTDLFEKDDEKFWSQSVLRRLKIRDKKSIRAAESANIRWGLSERNANGMRTHSERNANKRENKRENKIKIKRVEITQPLVKKSKKNYSEKKIDDSSPENLKNFDEIKRVFSQMGGTEKMAKKFFEKHESTGWMIQNTPIKNFATLVPGYIERWNQNDENEKNKINSSTSNGNDRTTNHNTYSDRP